MPRWSKWRSRIGTVGLLSSLLAPLGSCQDSKQARANRVIEIVKSTGQAEPPKVEYSTTPIADSPAGPREPAAVSTSYVRAFSSPAQNSRTPGSVRSGKWSIRWQAPLDSEAAAIL